MANSPTDPAASTIVANEPHVDPNAPTAVSGGGSVDLLVVGPQIGRFVLSGVLGQGGMGVVFRAHDPQLGRAVAIKVLRPDRSGHGRARLGREAQAMAKLSHPNVVTVYDVGEHDGATYIAMELVEGGTLRGWRRATPRRWREIVEIYVAAGRGLAAAHGAGLVHRDFKPDNVLIGGDARPRVTDFGIVSAPSGAIDSATIRGAALDANLTVDGSVLGTPAYMAPEQWRGEPVDARTDQFAFCVALWEALHGERPFAGDASSELRDAICAGDRRPPRVALPRGLTAALARGLSAEPAARWPTLPDLLDALAARARTRRGRMTAVAAAGLVASGGAVAALAWSPSSAPSCRQLERRMEQVWNDAARAQVTAAVSLDDAPSVILPLDDYVKTWVTMRIEACEADRRGERTTAVRGTQGACFDDALAQTRRVVATIASGALTPPYARGAVSNLPPLARCSDLPVLTATPPRPTDPALAARLVTVESVLSDAHAELVVDRFAAAHALASGIRAEAEAVGYAPTTARVLLVIGDAATQLGDNAGAEETLRAALRAADAGRDDHGRMEAYLALLDIVGGELGRTTEAKTLLADARGVLARIQPQARTRYTALLLASEATLASAEGDDARQLALLQEALPLYEASFGIESLTYAQLEYVLGGELVSNGDVVTGEPMLDRARAKLVGHMGSEAPIIAKVDGARAFARYKRGDLDGAIALQTSALALRERLEGTDSPTLSNGLYLLGAFEKEAGRLDEAARTLTRALALIERQHGAEHRRVVMALNELAETLVSAGRATEAARQAERAVEIADRLDVGVKTEAKARFVLATALPPAQRRRARALAERARGELRASGDEKAAKDVEAWLAKH